MNIYVLLFSCLQKGVDYVIALTHMRTPNDCRLAANVDEIDLILGGHDHVYEVKKVSSFLCPFSLVVFSFCKKKLLKSMCIAVYFFLFE